VLSLSIISYHLIFVFLLCRFAKGNTYKTLRNEVYIYWIVHQRCISRSLILKMG